MHAYGPPPLWQRQPGFGCHTVYYFGTTGIFDVCEGNFYQTHWFSSWISAHAIEKKYLDLDGLGAAFIDVVDRLSEFKGIGPWTANEYLLTALLRSDVWPEGDLALSLAIQNKN